MIGAEAVMRQFLGALDRAALETLAFPHWLIDAPLPAAVPPATAALPFAPPAIADSLGKRETHNSTRIFFSAANRCRFPVCAAVAAALQHRSVVQRLEALCGIRLAGAFLRIEYCQDSNGFWLEPHTDIGAKLFTMLIYLSTDDASVSWGTDLMTRDGAVLQRVPYRANSGFIFVPGSDTWHGFRKRPIAGVRRSLIVNYVTPGWRSRHELAYPDCAVG
ncbi:MAG TPA: 2OG-Fe(II) oxygenase [Stellaceae bacterium]|nr:2OG-Fe(II) oxygenase [Stellaceae bacterium]